MPLSEPEARKSGQGDPIDGLLGEDFQSLPLPRLNSPQNSATLALPMIRKASAYVLLLLLGLYLPVASMTVCVCLEPVDPDGVEDCCGVAVDCCQDSDPCWGESECCILIPGLPNGMEPQLIHAPAPLSLPAPLILADEFVIFPKREFSRTALSNRAPPPPPGAPIRIALGVWRL